MAWSAEDIPDQTGKVAVVTGANGGLGLEVSRELARKGAHVIMAARDPAKARAAHADILETVPARAFGAAGRWRQDSGLGTPAVGGDAAERPREV